ncbi:preprotein translocase subunit SecE [Candidatus Saccharibacteria bacterium]|nr:preprotein translocase subunit SecE [Candidatus Saccharibacteria bacterium]
MAKVTRIKASDSSRKEVESEPAIVRKKVTVADKKSEKSKKKTVRKATKKLGAEKSGKKPFILIRPVVYLFRYLGDSWKELRQVRWPNRKATWKMVLAVIIYTILFVTIITLLDMLFAWLFNLILGKG